MNEVKLTEAQKDVFRRAYRQHLAGQAFEIRYGDGRLNAPAKKLAEKGLVTEERYHTLKLTEAGLVLAKQMFSMMWWEELMSAVYRQYLDNCQRERAIAVNNKYAGIIPTEAKIVTYSSGAISSVMLDNSIVLRYSASDNNWRIHSTKTGAFESIEDAIATARTLDKAVEICVKLNQMELQS